MKLNVKILLAVFVVVCIYGGANWVIQNNVVFPDFLKLERKTVQEGMKRIHAALNREIAALGNTCHDWAAWDDSYRFVQNRNQKYQKTNMLKDTYKSLKINLLLLFDRDGNHVAGSGYDLAAEKFFDFREILPERLPQNHPLACVHGTDESVSGIIDTGRGPMLVAAQPITTSQNLGPVRGTMIMGLFFNREKIAQLQEQVVINFGATPIRKDSISQNDQETLAQLEKRGEDFLVRELSETRLSAYSIFPDIKGNPLLLLKADLPREIFSQGRQTILNSLLSTFLAGFLIILLLALVVRQQVGIPIKRLADHILTVRETGELEPVRLDNRHDEIGLLAEEFNSLLAELDNRNRAQKKNEAERERVIAELQEALLKIKTLTGLLPICASCKKIRDDKGYWNQIETYIREHSDVEFSHGICPDCYEKQMKELDRIFA